MRAYPDQATPGSGEGEAQHEAGPREVLKRFRLIFRAVQQHSHWVETRAGVSSAQLWALWELSRKPGLRVTELAKAMAIHQSTASNLLEKLVKKGLVTRNRISPDHRVVSLYLTESGQQTLERLPRPAQGILQNALSSLKPEILISLSRDLDLLIANMNIKDASGALHPIDAQVSTAEEDKI